MKCCESFSCRWVKCLNIDVCVPCSDALNQPVSSCSVGPLVPLVETSAFSWVCLSLFSFNSRSYTYGYCIGQSLINSSSCDTFAFGGGGGQCFKFRQAVCCCPPSLRDLESKCFVVFETSFSLLSLGASYASIQGSELINTKINIPLKTVRWWIDEWEKKKKNPSPKENFRKSKKKKKKILLTEEKSCCSASGCSSLFINLLNQSDWAASLHAGIVFAQFSQVQTNQNVFAPSRFLLPLFQGMLKGSLDRFCLRDFINSVEHEAARSQEGSKERGRRGIPSVHLKSTAWTGKQPKLKHCEIADLIKKICCCCQTFIFFLNVSITNEADALFTSLSS